MTTTITAGPTVLHPLIVEGWEARRQSRNIQHAIVSDPVPSYTLRNPAARAGTLRLLFANMVDATAAEAAHRVPRSFVLYNDDQQNVGMTYVLAAGGAVVLQLHETTAEACWLLVDYQEIS